MAGLIEDLRKHNATEQDAARELGRGLMHGARDELKLGYSWENAALAAIRMFDLPKHDGVELQCYLLGYGCGMQDVPVPESIKAKLGAISERLSDAVRDGFHRGQDTDPERVYPATIETAEAQAVRKRSEALAMKTCGCGATTKGECAAAVEGYFISLGQRSEEELRSLAEGDGCEAARVMLVERSLRSDEDRV